MFSCQLFKVHSLKKKWKNAHRIQECIWHSLIARLRGWCLVRNTISIWQIVTLSLNNCRKQRKTFRFFWLDETCSQLQPDKQLHGLQKLLVKGWDPGTSAQELGDGLHRHWHDLLHRVSSPTAPRSYCAIVRDVLMSCSLGSCLLLLHLSSSYSLYFCMEFWMFLLFCSVLIIIILYTWYDCLRAGKSYDSTWVVSLFVIWVTYFTKWKAGWVLLGKV